MIRFGIVGFGHIGKRHAQMITDHPLAKLLAICDIDESKNEPSRFDLPFYKDHKQLIEQHPEIDVVCVCTPNGLHAKHSIAALEANMHVVCEKPMALKLSAAESVISSALNHSKKVFCVMQNRYSPPSVWLKEMIASNRLGQIFMVQINCFWNRDDRYYAKSDWKGTMELDGGPLFTQFSHFVDMMYWLFGDIEDLSAQFACHNHQHSTDFEDSGLVNFRFKNGGQGAFNYSTSVFDQNLESSITIIAENGTIKVGGQYMETVQYCNVENYDFKPLPAANPPNDYGDYKGSAANHHFVIDNVVQTLNGQSIESTNALEGLKVVDIIERIYKLRSN